MKTVHLLGFYLTVMLGLVVFGISSPERLEAWLRQPEFYLHAKFVHIFCVTLFFSNVVIGTMWETRSLMTRRAEIIRYTYRTVVWLDAVFTAPLILISLVSGLMLATILGGVWNHDWLAIAFSLFGLSGVIWIALDIPSQYRVNRLFAEVPEGAVGLPPALTQMLWFRLGLNVFAIVPLFLVFVLMVHKPDLGRLRTALPLPASGAVEKRTPAQRSERAQGLGDMGNKGGV